MAVEQGPNDPAILNPRKRFVFRLWLPFGNDFAVFDKAANMQTFGVRRTATETGIFWGVLLLKRLLHDGAGLFAVGRTGVFAQLRPGIERARPNQAIVVVLLNHVSAPTGDS